MEEESSGRQEKELIVGESMNSISDNIAIF